MRVESIPRLRVALAVGAAAALAMVATAHPLVAQQVTEPGTQRVIRVTGAADVRVTPDVAHIDLAVETVGATARAAAEENARAMDRLIRALTAAGVQRTDIQTSGYSLFPEYARPDQGRDVEPDQPRIVGYRANNTVSVRTQDLTRVGPLIDAALSAGANRMHGLRFSIRDPEAAHNLAVREATARARRSAEAMAAALGVGLGEVAEASTTADPIRPFSRMESGMARDLASVATPIEPGEQTVSASVTLAYRIGGG